MHVCPMCTGAVPHVGGAILPPGALTVFIEGLPAARTEDMCVCVAPAPDVLSMGSRNVNIENKMAVRMGDTTAHGGQVTTGAGTVIIGVPGDGKISAKAMAKAVALAAAANAKNAKGDGNGDGNGEKEGKEDGEKADKAQSATLIVHIRKRSADGSPIPDVKVTIIGVDEKSGTTDKDGNFSLGEIGPGMYTVSASKTQLSPNPASTSIEIKTGENNVTLLLDCIVYELTEPKLIAHARNSVARHASGKTPFEDPEIPLGTSLSFGQDAEVEKGRKHPWLLRAAGNASYATELMKTLPPLFSNEDSVGMATRLCDDFLSAHPTPGLYKDDKLTEAVGQHPHFDSFKKNVLGAPGTVSVEQEAKGIHRALSAVDWDINKLTINEEFTPCSFNISENSTNGLGFMIGDVSHILVFADKYRYDSCEQKYEILLRFVLYDSFGLDDEDLEKWKIYLPGLAYWVLGGTAYQGIIAWWQLQHEFGYAPRITKVVLKSESISVSTAPSSPPVKVA